MAGPTSTHQAERLLGLLEAFARMTHQALFSASDKTKSRDTARAFLHRLGFDLDRLDSPLPIGFFPDCATIEERLRDAGFSADQIEASELVADPRLDGRLVGPIRDQQGCIRSFWARHPLGRRPQCLFKGRWRDEVAALGLDVAYPTLAGGRAPLVLVESLFDFLLIQSLGFPNIAAIGGTIAHMTQKRWERLAALGVRRVVLVLSTAEAGRQDARAALRNVARAKSAPEVCLVAPGRLGGYRTAGDLVRGEGIDAFRAILETPAPEQPTVQRKPSAADNRPRRGYCSLHRCRETDCFCFD